MFGLPFSVVINQIQNIALLMSGAIVAKGYVSSDQATAIIGGFVAPATAVSNYATHQSALDATPPAPAAPAPHAVAASIPAPKPPLAG